MWRLWIMDIKILVPAHRRMCVCVWLWAIIPLFISDKLDFLQSNDLFHCKWIPFYYYFCILIRVTLPRLFPGLSWWLHLRRVKYYCTCWLSFTCSAYTLTFCYLGLCSLGNAAAAPRCTALSFSPVKQICCVTPCASMKAADYPRCPPPCHHPTPGCPRRYKPLHGRNDFSGISLAKKRCRCELGRASGIKVSMKPPVNMKSRSGICIYSPI